MWIVKIALARPYTFIVLALLILLVSPIVILRTPTDVFPNIDIPVLASIWQYTGMNAEEMEGRMTSSVERSITTVVSNIEHTESLTLNGRAIIKTFLQPGASVDLANAQLTSISQSQLKSMPPGTSPPFILLYSASTVPILQLAISSDTRFRGATERLRSELHSPRSGDDSRRRDALAIRRQAAAGECQPEYRPSYRQKDFLPKTSSTRSAIRTLFSPPAPPRSASSNMMCGSIPARSPSPS